MPQRSVLCAAVMVAALGQADIGPPTRQVAGPDPVRTEPTTSKAVAEPARPVPERFLVRERGYRLLGPDGEEKEVLETSTNAAGAFSPDGRWAAFDGAKVAYTWQLPIREPEAKVERKTYLLTCDTDGGNRKTITMRSYKVPPNSSGMGSVIYFFEVLAWRK